MLLKDKIDKLLITRFLRLGVDAVLQTTAPNGEPTTVNLSQVGVLGKQAAAVAKTVTGTLTGADLLNGVITVNQGGGAASTQTLPTAAALDSAYPAAKVGDCFDFSVINISTVDAEDATIATATGWTLVGAMDVPARSAAGSLNTSARFRACKTGTATWTLYRLS